MESLSEVQLHCLKQLAAHGADHCSGALLEQLQRLGLAQRVVQGWLPLENPHGEYRISPAGKVLLERLARGDNAL